MTKLPTLVSLSEGENLSLDISVSGSPFPKITWSIHGRGYGDKTRFNITDEKFEIREVRLEDQGMITCRAENLFGVQETRVELVVSGKVVPHSSSLPATVKQRHFFRFEKYN